jgi:predicted nucleic acid-binding protein
VTVFVDTSVWIDFFRGTTSSVGDALEALLDDDAAALAIPVRIELVSGVRTAEVARLTRLLDALPIVRPTDATWSTIEFWAMESAANGQRFGFGDLLIGAIAAEYGGRVWSLDRDFSRMSQLGFIELYEPDR